jgi:hypothetical protein
MKKLLSGEFSLSFPKCLEFILLHTGRIVPYGSVKKYESK